MLVRIIGSFLRKHRLTKEGCADLHTSDMNKLSEFKIATQGDAMRVLSSVFIIDQSDTKNREYLISWL